MSSAGLWLPSHVTSTKNDLTMKELVEWYVSEPSVMLLGGAIFVVTSGYLGSDLMHEIGANETYWLYDITHQRRLLVTDAQRNYLSIPTSYSLRMNVVNAKGRVQPLNGSKSPVTVDEVCSSLTAGVPLQFVKFEDDQKVSFNLGVQGSSCARLGRLEIVDTYDEKYLLVHPIINCKMFDACVAIPVYMPITVNVIDGFRFPAESTGDKEEQPMDFKSWLSRVGEIANSLPKSSRSTETCPEIIQLEGKPDGGHYEYIRPSTALKQITTKQQQLENNETVLHQQSSDEHTSSQLKRMQQSRQNKESRFKCVALPPFPQDPRRLMSVRSFPGAFPVVDHHHPMPARSQTVRRLPPPPPPTDQLVRIPLETQASDLSGLGPDLPPPRLPPKTYRGKAATEGYSCRPKERPALTNAVWTAPTNDVSVYEDTEMDGGGKKSASRRRAPPTLSATDNTGTDSETDSSNFINFRSRSTVPLPDAASTQEASDRLKKDNDEFSTSTSSKDVYVTCIGNGRGENKSTRAGIPVCVSAPDLRKSVSSDYELFDFDAAPASATSDEKRQTSTTRDVKVKVKVKVSNDGGGARPYEGLLFEGGSGEEDSSPTRLDNEDDDHVYERVTPGVSGTATDARWQPAASVAPAERRKNAGWKTVGLQPIDQPSVVRGRLVDDLRRRFEANA